MQVYKAIKYIRLSYTDDKTVESDSVANQRRLIDDYIARHPEIEVVAEKIDDGYSGVLFDRPAFQEMMRMIEQGEANCVIVKDLSRLGREYIETGRYMRRVFPAYGVRFIAINDNVDTENDAADDLTVSVKNIMNEAYCRDISVKTRSALEVKRRSGDFVGAFTIYGYVKVGDKHKSLEVDEYAANVVRDIFRKRLEGFSASHIADELNRLGILSPLAYKRNHGMPHAKGGYTDRKDCKWSATTIIRILQDETYTGTLVQGKQTTPHFKLKEREDKPSSEWIRVEGTHEAIIQKHDFDLVQRLRRIDTRTSPKSDKVYLFSGILICGCCGCRMTRKTNRYKDKEYGYRKDPDDCHKLLIDENTAPVVKQIFEWAHEHVALNRIVRNLNEMGIPAPSHYKKTTGEITSPGLIGSGKWQTRTVMKILESEVYTGDLVQGKTKIVDHQQVKAGEDNLIIAKCTHEPIISYELFNAVQEYRKQICEESKATPKRPYTPNIFKGKVFCADCGRSLHRQRAERRKGPDTYWFHCLTNSRVEKDSCKGAMIQEKELISTVTAILEKELTVALGMSLPLFQLEARQKQEKDKLKIQMSAKRQEIEKTRRLIRDLYENFVQGILTNDEYFELKADYEYAINALSGEIEVFEKSMDSLDNQLARYRAMEKDAKTLAQDHVLTAELIERLIERIEIDHERNIHVTFRFKNEFQGKAVEPCATM